MISIKHPTWSLPDSKSISLAVGCVDDRNSVDTLNNWLQQRWRLHIALHSTKVRVDTYFQEGKVSLWNLKTDVYMALLQATSRWKAPSCRHCSRHCPTRSTPTTSWPKSRNARIWQKKSNCGTSSKKWLLVWYYSFLIAVRELSRCILEEEKNIDPGLDLGPGSNRWNRAV